MKSWMKIGIIIVAILAVVAIPVVSTYNSLVTVQNDVEEQWANVDSKLQRRFDLIPNLVNSVKGSMKQEKEVFGQIAEARTQYGSAKSTNEKVEASNQLDSALSRLLVVTENYPDLKSNENVTKLMDELAGTENRISVERDRYNKVVKDYNAKTKRFPGSIVAGMFGFEKMKFFEATAGADKAPTVDLN
ncbi:LemA family protein [Brochothrix thermosphacta]|uniref:LemA family protein n=1 Tax=Brochothrix thermosphacta TaxID=2756 RepID=UPI00083FBD06|nr:LemA family protein [Brochothrix thermosphacta]ODJ52729.1 LemA family protein [Brochothrix thermosphacta]ODJ61010.1 LemA family protein [Brochothrix thermosphacta]